MLFWVNWISESFNSAIRIPQLELQSPHRLARPRTPAFHAGNRGSNPLGDAKSFWRDSNWQTLLLVFGLILYSGQGHPAFKRDNRGELVLSIDEGNPLGDAKIASMAEK